MSKKKPIKIELDFLRDNNWKIVKRTRKGAQQIANRMARKRWPKGFWNGVVADCGEYYRINIAGQPERPRFY